MSNIEESKKKIVTLTLTEDCNLRCPYCYEENKTKRSMSFETAKRIIEQEMNDTEGYDFVSLEFFGGEPFKEFELMKQIVDFVKKSRFKTPHSMFASTNGTLIHGEVQEWLLNNRDVFSIGLSLDGTKEMHDTNRCNSFDMIDLDFYRKFYSNQGVKMTVSKETLPKLYEGVKFCHDMELECFCNLAYGIDWSAEENKKILENQLTKLIDFYIENPNITPCSMLGNKFWNIGYDTDETVVKKWCGSSTNMHTYDVDGEKYPCQFFMPLSAGEDKAKEAKNMIIPLEIPLALLDEKCRCCVIRNACPTCYGSNFVSTGNIFSKDDNLCTLNKITLKARSYFRAIQLERGLLQLNETEEQALVRSIIKIQNELKI